MNFGQVLLGILKSMDWKKIGYNAYQSAVRPFLASLVQKTDTPFDDVCLQGIDRIVELYLKPSAQLEA